LDSGEIDSAKFPVIGSDGMLQDQYTHPWVWPVATSTSSVMHIMAANAKARGATKFGIVYDQHYRFGQEGFDAFRGEVERGGGRITSKQPIDSGGGNSGYNAQARQFVQDCGGDSWSNCDFVAMLLEPATAQQWVAGGGLGNGQQKPGVGIGVPQPLFVNSFARACGGMCDGMWAWTSFKPPISPFDGEQSVATYKGDLAAVNSGADANNPHVEGAYVGMLLVVDSLTKLGPNPTRDGIRQVLDAETLDVGLGVSPIKFSPVGTQPGHYGAIGAQAFQDTAAGNSFANWRYVSGSSTQDASVGKGAS
jgi:ABC-type branched-subunit amino acid transport system substrate-binding protein